VRNARTVEIWGTGTPKCEFPYVDDLADGLAFMRLGSRLPEPGHRDEIIIRALAELLARVAGWSGEFVYDPNKPDGTPRKIMDVSKPKALG